MDVVADHAAAALEVDDAVARIARDVVADNVRLRETIDFDAGDVLRDLVADEIIGAGVLAAGDENAFTAAADGRRFDREMAAARQHGRDIGRREDGRILDRQEAAFELDAGALNVLRPGGEVHLADRDEAGALDVDIDARLVRRRLQLHGQRKLTRLVDEAEQGDRAVNLERFDIDAGLDANDAAPAAARMPSAMVR